jgi:hypothetical protein
VSRVVLLGPQRFRPTVGEVVRSLGVQGPITTVTAGWQEREAEDAELVGLLDGRGVNLELYRRWLDVYDRDPEFGAADRHRRDVLDELQAVYLVGLRHAMAAVAELRRHGGDPAVWSVAADDAVAVVRTLDARHLERVREVHDEFHAAWPPHERPVVAEHRAAIAGALASAGALAVGGGHVGVLLACLHLFNVAAAVGDRPVVAWSAGAMAMTDTVVLFHDHAAHGQGYAEVFEAGLGLVHGVVALPHARRRLRLGDRRHMALLARRFAPAVGLVLDDGARYEVGRDAGVVVGEDGTVAARAA